MISNSDVKHLQYGDILKVLNASLCFREAEDVTFSHLDNDGYIYIVRPPKCAGHSREKECGGWVPNRFWKTDKTKLEDIHKIPRLDSSILPNL